MSKLNPVPPEAAAQSDLQTAFETAMEYKLIVPAFKEFMMR